MQNQMSLTIQLPSRIFLDQKSVVRIVVESRKGSFGILPRRLDCIANLVPGILMYETDSGQAFHIAIDEGILVKEGKSVKVSVRNAIGDVPLVDLPACVEARMKDIDAEEMALRSSISHLQSSLIGSFKRGN